ncbi:MAG: ATP-binding cassette domain-containing protein, partial [Euryarchaeota archaeon]
MATALECQGLWKLYEMGEEKIQAVRGINLSIQQGDMIAIMGPSGCGKTTLLNVLSG